jgi:hypothetical protein
MSNKRKIALLLLIALGISCNAPKRLLDFATKKDDESGESSNGEVLPELREVLDDAGYFDSFLPNPSEFFAKCYPNSEEGTFNLTFDISINFETGVSSKVTGTLYTESIEEEETPSGKIIRKWIVDASDTSVFVWPDGMILLPYWVQETRLEVLHPDGRSRITEQSAAWDGLMGHIDVNLDSMTVCVFDCGNFDDCLQRANGIRNGGIQNRCRPYSIYQCSLSRTDTE